MKGVGRPVIILAAVLAAVPLVAIPAAAQTGSVERPFAPGGQVRMDLSAADYTIEAGQDNRILVRWEARSPEDAARVKVDIQRQGSTATIRTWGPRNNLRMVVELPPREDLHVDLSAGDLKIRGISGNKDVGSWAGDIDVDIGRGEEYSVIDTAVKAGEIRARPLNAERGGLFRSFRWNGPGRYTLRVRLTAGDLRLL